MNRQPVILCLLTALLCMCGCSRLNTCETFVKVSSKDAAGRYPFSVEMTDDGTEYDFVIFLRSDCSDAFYFNMPDYQVIISAESPSGKLYKESLVIPKGQMKRKSGAKDVEFAYMTGVVPKEPGTWRFFLVFPQEDSIPNFRGAGLRTIKRN